MKKLLSLVLAAAMLLSLVPAAFAEEAETKSINGKEYGVDYTSLYSQFGKDTTIADVTEDEETGLCYIEKDGVQYELGLDFLTMAMVYNTQVVDGWDTEDDVYATWWRLYMQRWNYLLPEIPLYSNVYVSMFPDWLENYEQDSFWDFSQAILYANVAGYAAE